VVIGELRSKDCPRHEGAFRGGPGLAVTIRMIGFDGRLRWRQEKLFKLCAKLAHR
jgi:hypothetical protein